MLDPKVYPIRLRVGKFQCKEPPGGRGSGGAEPGRWGPRSGSDPAPRLTLSTVPGRTGSATVSLLLSPNDLPMII
eukprot:465129-Hanusia_phi.AAC.3